MESDDVWQTVDSERLGVADLLDALDPAEWDVPSLCAGWRVRDVAAHLTLAHTGPMVAVRELLRAGGSFDRMVHRTAVRQAALPVDELTRRLRAMVGSRRKAPMVSELEPMVDILVHCQDIAIPLGRVRETPKEAAAVAASRVWAMGWPFRAARRLRGFELVASDHPWRMGEGERVEGPVSALLLLSAGRDAALRRLAGPGVAALTTRLNRAARSRSA